MKNEFHLIERLKSLIPRTLQGRFGIGDDAAILPAGRGKSFLFTTDAILEGIDFRIGDRMAPPEKIGRKALAVNLSDIAAMGGRPTAFVTTFGIPQKFSGQWIERVSKGIIQLARRFQVQWVGGDMTKAKQFFISIALLGEVETKKCVQRKGARPGNSIYVTGELGGSIHGKHLSFTPRLLEAQYLVNRFHPTSMIDISDGFIQDLEHLLASSRVGAQIDLDRIPVSNAALHQAGGAEKKALQSALSDGEDFELLFTLPLSEGGRLEKVWQRKFRNVSLTRVGEINRSAGKIEWFKKREKIKLWFPKKGFSHF